MLIGVLGSSLNDALFCGVYSRVSSDEDKDECEEEEEDSSIDSFIDATTTTQYLNGSIDMINIYRLVLFSQLYVKTFFKYNFGAGKNCSNCKDGSIIIFAIIFLASQMLRVCQLNLSI